jgi:photosystem II stability/assembly factor-like uncharacterized protein
MERVLLHLGGVRLRALYLARAKARALARLLPIALLLSASAAVAEPVKQLSHRDRLYDATSTGGALYAVGHPGLVLRSRDGGKSFENVQAGQTDDALFSIAFNPKGQGAIAGRSGVVLTTEDGGKSWLRHVVKLGEESPSLFSVSVLPSGVIVAVGEFGAIARSEDNGKTWTRSSYTIKIEPPAKGQAAPGPECNTAGSAESDNDDVVQEARLTDVAFANDQLGFIVAEFGLVLRSDDGGKTFKRQNSCTDKLLYSVATISATRAIAVGAEGTAVETNDGGFTWAPRATSTPEHLFGVFANAKYAVVLGAAGVALARDGDGAFKVAQTGVHGWLTGAWVDEAGKGVIVGGRGYLRTTRDGGKTQQRVFGE